MRRNPALEVCGNISKPLSRLLANRRRAALVLAAAGAIAPCSRAMAATITTANGGVTGAVIAQPDFSNTNFVNWEDQTNDGGASAQGGQGYPYPSGPGQVFFVPANTNINLQSITIKGGGPTGGSLANWTITVGSINVAAPYYGAPATIMDTETASGTPIVNDVANGITTNYDQFTLATPQVLTGAATTGSYYFFALDTLDSTNSTGGYYTLAKSAAADPNKYVSTTIMDLNGASSSTVHQQPFDYTYFINGTLVTIPDNAATWGHAGGGNWITAADWVSSAPPATSNSTATFDTDGGTITGSTTTVTLTTIENVKSLTFNNPSGYNLAGSTVNVTTQLTSSAGANTINSLGIGSSGLTIAPGSSLTVTTFAHSQYNSLLVNGGGTLNIVNYTDPQGNLDVTGGTTVNITGSMPAGAFFYDIGVASVTDVVNLGTNNTYDSNSISGDGTIVIGTGSTLTSAEFNGFTFAGSLSGSGSLILGSAAGSANLGAPYNGAFLGTSPNFSGPITAAYDSILQVGAGATLGNASATNLLTLDSGVLQAAGNATLAQNISLIDSVGISATPGSAVIDTQTNTLTLTGNISGYQTLQKNGAGTLVLSGTNIYSGGTNVTAGLLQVAGPHALPTNSVLTIAAGAEAQLATGVTAGTQSANPPVTAPTSSVTLSSLSIAAGGTFDLNNDHIIINYGGGADPIASIVSMIKSGADVTGGVATWLGTGITSTAAQSNAGSYGIGYADSADPGNPAGLASGQIEIMYTLLGDANLDGKVNGTDFNILAANFNTGGDSWDQGDFTYDGKVNGSDFNLLAQNFNQGATQAAGLAALDSFAAANGISLTSVPEPASIGLLAVGIGSLLGRRRRRN